METFKYVLDPKLLAPLAGYPLFYPSSGSDFYNAIAVFAPSIREFWFVDIEEYRDIHNLPSLHLSKEYQPLGQSIELADSVYCGRREEWTINPMVRTDRYLHTPSGNEIVIHRRHGSGPWALRTLDRIGIFYYRGDSWGEGGSGCRWLAGPRSRIKKNKAWLVDLLLSCLVDGGLLVTDGSTAQWGEYEKHLARYSQYDIKDDLVAFQDAQTLPFTDLRGNHFECVGLAGFRYGPVLIWRVTKSGSTTR